MKVQMKEIHDILNLGKYRLYGQYITYINQTRVQGYLNDCGLICYVNNIRDNSINNEISFKDIDTNYEIITNKDFYIVLEE